MNQARKFVIRQKNTGLYYRPTNSGSIAFGPLSSANVYVTLEGVIAAWEHVKVYGGFDVTIHPVHIYAEPECRNEILFALENRLETLKREFEPLDREAALDIDAMSEIDYQRWKKLKSKIKNEVSRIALWTESFFTINS